MGLRPQCDEPIARAFGDPPPWGAGPFGCSEVLGRAERDPDPAPPARAPRGGLDLCPARLTSVAARVARRPEGTLYDRASYGGGCQTTLANYRIGALTNSVRRDGCPPSPGGRSLRIYGIPGGTEELGRITGDSSNWPESRRSFTSRGDSAADCASRRCLTAAWMSRMRKRSASWSGGGQVQAASIRRSTTRLGRVAAHVWGRPSHDVRAADRRPARGPGGAVRPARSHRPGARRRDGPPGRLGTGRDPDLGPPLGTKAPHASDRPRAHSRRPDPGGARSVSRIAWEPGPSEHPA